MSTTNGPDICTSCGRKLKYRLVARKWVTVKCECKKGKGSDMGEEFPSELFSEETGK